MTTLEIKHRVLTTVDSMRIQLPFYFSYGTHAKSYCVMTTEYTLIDLRHNKTYLQIDTTQYDDADDATYRMEREMTNETLQEINEAVFMHNFSLAHRQLYDMVNPNIKHNATK